MRNKKKRNYVLTLCDVPLETQHSVVIDPILCLMKCKQCSSASSDVGKYLGRNWTCVAMRYTVLIEIEHIVFK